MSAEPVAPRREDLADGSVRIHFAAPILFHDEPRRFVTLRPPTVREVIEIGDPVTWVYSADGGATSVVERPILLRLVMALIVDHDFDFLAGSRDIALGLLLEEVVLGFFRNARTRLRAASAPSSGAA